VSGRLPSFGIAVVVGECLHLQQQGGGHEGECVAEKDETCLTVFNVIREVTVTGMRIILSTKTTTEIQV
jgi:hypothetical protein